MIAFIIFFLLLVTMVGLTVVMVLSGVNFGQYMHQRDVEQGAHCDQKYVASPEVNGMPFRVVSADVSISAGALEVEDHKGQEGGQG